MTKRPDITDDHRKMAGRIVAYAERDHRPTRDILAAIGVNGAFAPCRNMTVAYMQRALADGNPAALALADGNPAALALAATCRPIAEPEEDSEPEPAAVPAPDTVPQHGYNGRRIGLTTIERDILAAVCVRPLTAHDLGWIGLNGTRAQLARKGLLGRKLVHADSRNPGGIAIYEPTFIGRAMLATYSMDAV